MVVLCWYLYTGLVWNVYLIKRGDLVHLQQFYLWEMFVYLHVYMYVKFTEKAYAIFTLIAGWSSISTTCQMSSE